MVKVVKNIELAGKLWKYNKTRGPDVEELLFVPLFVAVESKKTAADALASLQQIVGYAKSRSYDAVILRLEEDPPRDQYYESLVHQIKKQGIGLVVGGGPYTPLTGSEEIMLKARVNFRARLTRELSEMQLIKLSVQSEEDFVNHLLFARKYFT